MHSLCIYFFACSLICCYLGCDHLRTKRPQKSLCRDFTCFRWCRWNLFSIVQSGLPINNSFISLVISESIFEVLMQSTFCMFWNCSLCHQSSSSCLISLRNTFWGQAFDFLWQISKETVKADIRFVREFMLSVSNFSAFGARWLAGSKMISQVLFTSERRTARVTLKIDHFSVNCYRCSSFWRY